jgi:acyl carrier protein
MPAELTREDILSAVKTEVLWKGMQLEELGFGFADLNGGTRILGEGGLGLDSVDSLEIVVQIQKVFRIKIKDVNRELFETDLRTIDTMVDFVKRSLDARPSDE